MDPTTISLIAMLLDLGIDRAIDLYKAFSEANIDLPTLEQIKADVGKWQKRADSIDETIREH